MRRLIAIVCFVLLCGSAVKAQYVNLPDSNFRNYLRFAYPTCFNAAGQMDTACIQIANVESLYLNNSSTFTIDNFEGLQYLKRLKHFECQYIDSNDIFPALPDSLVDFICQYNSGLQSLPAMPTSLRYFNCANSYFLTTLPPLNAGLKRLDCSDCEKLITFPAQLPPSLTYFNATRCRPYFSNSSTSLVLPPLPPGLDTLYCSECSLVTLPALPNSLVYLDCSRNPITSLPAFPNSIQYLNCNGFRWYAPPFDEDTSRVDLPALPSSLKYFNCSGSGFRAMQPLPAALETLWCSGVPVSSSIVFPSSLQYLNCSNCGIRTFSPLLNKLKSLDCSGNPLHSIPYLSDSLTYLNCANDSLTSLPALPAGLTNIYCYQNQLTSLPSLPNSLYHLTCEANRLTALPPLPASLNDLNCGSNMLTSLPALPDTLNRLYCPWNRLTALPALPRNLWDLNCQNNQLTYLPELPSSLWQVYCEGNNIYCLPKLPQSANMWIYADRKINCVPNTAPGVYVEIYDTANAWPTRVQALCNPTNNSYHCQAYPIIQGNVYFDSNNNGVKDANEPFKINARVNLSNDAYTFSNNNGQFEIGADNIGNFSLTTIAPRYYKYVPASYNLNFTSYDTLLISRNFALQIDSIIDELTIRITPINWAARPGFSFPYMISYENTGTTTLSPNIVFDYDETRLNYNTSSVLGVTDNASMLAYNTGALEPGQSGNFIGYFTLKTTVPLGDSLNAKAIINANSFTAYDSVLTTVRGAFDPNDKQATPQLSPSQVANGKFIDYTIRFQNTGTDTAFNVVISDTLNENLQANTLEMLVSSHNCKTTVKDNIVFFEFLNILLPDSNINESKSHGFVSFRIKPQTTVLPNTSIPNNAAIYFDYNAPVITNIAATLIKDFTVIPLKLISFSAVPQNDNTVSLYWNTANEINTRQFVIERGNDGLRFNAITSIAAKGKAANDYFASVKDENTGIQFYRLKIVDNDGTFSYSPIIKIDRRKNSAGISVLTNPVKDILIINATDRMLNNTQANIINMQGAVVKTFIVKEGSQAVNIKHVPNGIYYLRTVNGSSRIIKQ